MRPSNQKIAENSSIAQAYLMIGPRHAFIIDFVKNFIAKILCANESGSCGTCKNCQMFANNSHPDVEYILQESDSRAIKIEAIRNLQLDIFQTPQCAKHRFVVINPADKLNIQAANALLKILEEPPKHTVFILIAEQINSLPLTIISRCHKYFIKEPKHEFENDLDNNFAIAKFYAKNDERAVLYEDRFTIISLLNDLVAGRTNICVIAAAWKNFNLENIIWFIYLITSQAIKYLLLGDENLSEDYAPFYKFAKTQNIDALYSQLDTLNKYIKKNQQNITLNSTLVLENLLLGYIPC